MLKIVGLVMIGAGLSSALPLGLGYAGLGYAGLGGLGYAGLGYTGLGLGES